MCGCATSATLALGERISPGPCVFGKVRFNDTARSRQRSFIEILFCDKGRTSIKKGGFLRFVIDVACLLTETPVTVRNFFLVHVAGPVVGGAGVGVTIAIGVGSAPFTDEHWVSFVQGGLNVSAIAAFAMGGGVEMEYVGDILCTHRVTSTLLGILRPNRCTNNNQVVGVFTDRRRDRVGVAFDVSPVSTASVYGLVVDFINDIGNVFVFCGNFGEERITRFTTNFK